MTGSPPPEKRRWSLWGRKPKPTPRPDAATETGSAGATPETSPAGTGETGLAGATSERSPAGTGETGLAGGAAGKDPSTIKAAPAHGESSSNAAATAVHDPAGALGGARIPAAREPADTQDVDRAEPAMVPIGAGSPEKAATLAATRTAAEETNPSVPGGPRLTAPAEPVPAEPDPAAPEPMPAAPNPPAPVSPAPGGPGPIAPAEPEPVPDMPVSPAPAGPAEPGRPDGPLADLPPIESAGTSVADEVSAELAAQAPEPAAQPAPRKPEAGEWRGIVLVTGTDTDVGKTIVTAAIAASAQAAGLRVAVIKPGQTGTAGGGSTDIEVINRLAAPHTARTLASFPEPLAPLAAAKVANLPPLELYEVVDTLRAESARHDLVLVEGAGGLLVPMGVRPSGEAWTLADLATTLGVSTIVVSRAGLGTLNHTALTLEALARRGVPVGVVLGAWPAEPELVHWANLSEMLPHLVGALPDGAGAMEPGVFRRSAPGWLTPALYGVVDDWRVWAEEIS
jgi:dethiobiotin synthetase